MNIAIKIKELRESVGMTRKEFAEYTGIPLSTVITAMVISWSKRLGPQLPGFSHRRLSIIFSKYLWVCPKMTICVSFKSQSTSFLL